MALKTKAAIKTQLDAVAAALTLAIADTVAGVATQNKDNRSPLRNVNKLLDVSDAGVVTINTAKWDALWDGAGAVMTAPTQGTGSGTYVRKILT